MKRYMYILLIMILIYSCSNKPYNDASNLEKFDFVLKCDSGYVDSIYTVKLLLVLDRAFLKNENFKEFDKPKTKYYYNKINQKFTGCISGCHPQYCYFFEISINSNSLKTNKYIVVGHENVNCCAGEFDDFYYNGVFFTFRNCVSGSSSCETHMYIFDALLEKDKMANILIEKDVHFPGNYTLNSSIQYKSDTIFVYYTRTIFLDEQRKNDSKNKIQKFIIKGVFKNNKLELLNASVGNIDTMGWK